MEVLSYLGNPEATLIRLIWCLDKQKYYPIVFQFAFTRKPIFFCRYIRAYITFKSPIT